MNFEISLAVLSDIPALVKIFNEATSFKIDHGDMTWGNEPFTEAEVRGYLHDSNTYVVWKNHIPIGTLSINFQDNRIWGEKPHDAIYLHRLAIKQDQHGQNIGEQIIKFACQEALKHNRKFLRLDCEERNIELCSYYEKLGFIKKGTSHPVSEGREYIAALFEKAI